MDDRMVRDQEAANVAACLEAATAAGHTPEQAEECDDGSVGCPECPWGKKARCREAADRNGISRAQADNCWEGLVGCEGCPIYPAVRKVKCKACGTETEMADSEPETECSDCGGYLRNPNFKCPNGDQQIEPNPNGNW